MTPVFVYENRNTGAIQVRAINRSTGQLDLPLSESEWKLIKSLEAPVYIESLLNKYPALVRVLKGEGV